MKNWYAAHLVMLVKYTSGRQQRVPAWENVVLIEANDDDEAWAKAEAIGAAECENGDGSERWNGRSFKWEFAGVRRLCLCAVFGDRPSGGDEVTYHELEFDSLATAKRYANGRSAMVRHNDTIQTIGPQVAETPKAKRKRA